MEERIIKRCMCGASYSQAQWSALHYVGPLAADGAAAEMRVCASCHSTIAVRIGPTRAKRPAKKG